jgi:hypothetical protein
LYPDKFDLKKIWHVTRSDQLIEQIKRQVPVEDIVESWRADLTSFSKIRIKYILY